MASGSEKPVINKKVLRIDPSKLNLNVQNSLKNALAKIKVPAKKTAAKSSGEKKIQNVPATKTITPPTVSGSLLATAGQPVPVIKRLTRPQQENHVPPKTSKTPENVPAKVPSTGNSIRDRMEVTRLEIQARLKKRIAAKAEKVKDDETSSLMEVKEEISEPIAEERTSIISSSVIPEGDIPQGITFEILPAPVLIPLDDSMNLEDQEDQKPLIIDENPIYVTTEEDSMNLEDQEDQKPLIIDEAPSIVTTKEVPSQYDCSVQEMDVDEELTPQFSQSSKISILENIQTQAIDISKLKVLKGDVSLISPMGSKKNFLRKGHSEEKEDFVRCKNKGEGSSNRVEEEISMIIPEKKQKAKLEEKKVPELPKKKKSVDEIPAEKEKEGDDLVIQMEEDEVPGPSKEKEHREEEKETKPEPENEKKPEPLESPKKPSNPLTFARKVKFRPIIPGKAVKPVKIRPSMMPVTEKKKPEPPKEVQKEEQEVRVPSPVQVSEEPKGETVSLEKDPVNVEEIVQVKEVAPPPSVERETENVPKVAQVEDEVIKNSSTEDLAKSKSVPEEEESKRSPSPNEIPLEVHLEVTPAPGPSKGSSEVNCDNSPVIEKTPDVPTPPQETRTENVLEKEKKEKDPENPREDTKTISPEPEKSSSNGSRNSLLSMFQGSPSVLKILGKLSPGSDLQVTTAEDDSITIPKKLFEKLFSAQFMEELLKDQRAGSKEKTGENRAEEPEREVPEPPKKVDKPQDEVQEPVKEVEEPVENVENREKDNHEPEKKATESEDQLKKVEEPVANVLEPEKEAIEPEKLLEEQEKELIPKDVELPPEISLEQETLSESEDCSTENVDMAIDIEEDEIPIDKCETTVPIPEAEAETPSEKEETPEEVPEPIQISPVEEIQEPEKTKTPATDPLVVKEELDQKIDQNLIEESVPMEIKEESPKRAIKRNSRGLTKLDQFFKPKEVTSSSPQSPATRSTRRSITQKSVAIKDKAIESKNNLPTNKQTEVHPMVRIEDISQVTEKDPPIVPSEPEKESKTVETQLEYQVVKKPRIIIVKRIARPTSSTKSGETEKAMVTEVPVSKKQPENDKVPQVATRVSEGSTKEGNKKTSVETLTTNHILDDWKDEELEDKKEIPMEIEKEPPNPSNKKSSMIVLNPEPSKSATRNTSTTHKEPPKIPEMVSTRSTRRSVSNNALENEKQLIQSPKIFPIKAKKPEAPPVKEPKVVPIQPAKVEIVTRTSRRKSTVTEWNIVKSPEKATPDTPTKLVMTLKRPSTRRSSALLSSVEPPPEPEKVEESPIPPKRQKVAANSMETKVVKEVLKEPRKPPPVPVIIMSAQPKASSSENGKVILRFKLQKPESSPKPIEEPKSKLTSSKNLAPEVPRMIYVQKPPPKPSTSKSPAAPANQSKIKQFFSPGEPKTSEKIDNMNNTCGNCKQVVPVKEWRKHVDLHNGLTWIEGIDPPLDFSDQNLAIRTVLGYMRSTGKKNLVCSKCNDVKTSALGFVQHNEKCGKTDAELEANKFECPYCEKKIDKNGKSAHFRRCAVLKQETQREREASRAMQEKISEQSGLFSGRGRRIQSRKMQPTKTDLRQYFHRKMFSARLLKKWSADAKLNLNLSCFSGMCKFTTKDALEMENHHNACSMAQENKFTCRICHHEGKNEAQMEEHVLSKHFKDKEQESEKEEEVDESDASVGSESSESEGSSGEDEVDSDEGEESEVEKLEYSGNPWIRKKWFPPKVAQMDDKVLPKVREMVRNFQKFKEINFSEEPLFLNWMPPKPKNIVKVSQDFAEVLPGESSESFVNIKSDLIVECVEWLPQNDDTKSPILGVLCKPKNLPYFQLSHKQPMETLLQIWSIERDSTLSATCKYSVVRPDGPICGMKFCPSGGETKDRLGLIAMTSVNGDVNVIALPHFDSSFPGKSLKLPVSKVLKGVESIGTTIDWDLRKGHGVIMGGFMNGFVAMWKLNAENCRLLEDSDGGLLPFQTFCPLMYPITSLVMNNSFFLVAGGLSLKVYEKVPSGCMEVLHEPLSTAITFAKWIPNTVFIHRDFQTHITEIGAFFYAPYRNIKDQMKVFRARPMTAGSYSPYLNILLGGSRDGEIFRRPMNTLGWKDDDRTVKKISYIEDGVVKPPTHNKVAGEKEEVRGIEFYPTNSKKFKGLYAVCYEKGSVRVNDYVFL